MVSLLRKFWHDDCGAVGPEWACAMAVLVLGSVASLVIARQALSHDLEKVAALVAEK